jgi:hypothetical protein
LINIQKKNQVNAQLIKNLFRCIGNLLEHLFIIPVGQMSSSRPQFRTATVQQTRRIVPIRPAIPPPPQRTSASSTTTRTSGVAGGSTLGSNDNFLARIPVVPLRVVPSRSKRAEAASSSSRFVKVRDFPKRSKSGASSLAATPLATTPLATPLATPSATPSATPFATPPDTPLITRASLTASSSTAIRPTAPLPAATTNLRYPYAVLPEAAADAIWIADAEKQGLVNFALQCPLGGNPFYAYTNLPRSHGKQMLLALNGPANSYVAQNSPLSNSARQRWDKMVNKKQSFFGKLSLERPYIDRSQSLAWTNSGQWEAAFLRTVGNTLIRNRVTPHISAYATSLTCDVSSEQTWQSERQSLNEMVTEYRGEGGYDDNIVQRLQIARGFVSQYSESAETLHEWAQRYHDVDAWRAVLFQIIYSIDAFTRLGIRHNDLHHRNIIVAPGDQPFSLDSSQPISDYLYLTAQDSESFWRVPVVKHYVYFIDWSLATIDTQQYRRALTPQSLADVVASSAEDVMRRAALETALDQMREQLIAANPDEADEYRLLNGSEPTDEQILRNRTAEEPSLAETYGIDAQAHAKYDLHHVLCALLHLGGDSSPNRIYLLPSEVIAFLNEALPDKEYRSVRAGGDPQDRYCRLGEPLRNRYPSDRQVRSAHQLLNESALFAPFRHAKTTPDGVDQLAAESLRLPLFAPIGVAPLPPWTIENFERGIKEYLDEFGGAADVADESRPDQSGVFVDEFGDLVDTSSALVDQSGIAQVSDVENLLLQDERGNFENLRNSSFEQQESSDIQEEDDSENVLESDLFSQNKTPSESVEKVVAVSETEPLLSQFRIPLPEELDELDFSVAQPFPFQRGYYDK